MSAKVYVVSGFLGAGKTSAIVGMGKRLIAQGKKVGVVTNDQGGELVDTNFLRSEGLAVFEVTKGCFCCNFDEFTAKLDSMSEEIMPDIILAEPVGSCTDLVATIFKPMLNRYEKNFLLAPLSVVVDPGRALKFMKAQDPSGTLNEINYLFDKQLSEADLIILNKCDLVSREDAAAITSFLQKRYKGAELLSVSTLTGMGMDGWLEILLSAVMPAKPSLHLEYDTYANAEAALGWMNLSAAVQADAKIDCNDFIEETIENIRMAAKRLQVEIAHLKIYAVSGIDFAKAGIVSTSDTVNFNKRMQFDSDRFNLVINARIQTAPELLDKMVSASLNKTLDRYSATANNVKSDCFSPCYPKPVWRLK